MTVLEQQNTTDAEFLPLEILSEAHLRALTDDEEIRKSLRSAELQTLIRNVDSSRCRLEALAAAQHNIPEFKAFCDAVLRNIHTVS